MSESSEWDDLLAGKNCVLCSPREDRNEFSVKIKDLSVSTLYLDRGQTYRGYCVLIFKKRHVTGLEQLSDEEYRDYTDDLRQAMKAIFSAVKPDHMNYATLGNSIPHLHYHIIPRYKGDPCWRSSVWTTPPSERAQKQLNSEAEYDELAGKIKKHF